MPERRQSSIDWIDVVWLLFLAALAFLPPINEIHKQLILLAFGVFQYFESTLVARLPARGAVYSVLIKIVLATLLLDHTGDVGINSSIIRSIMCQSSRRRFILDPSRRFFGPRLRLLPTVSFLIPAHWEYEITAQGLYILAIRILFFFLVGDAGKPLRDRKSPSGGAISGAIGNAGGNEQAVAPRGSRSPSFRAPCGTRPNVGRTRSRNPQSFRRYQGIGRNPRSKTAGRGAPCKRTRRIHLLRSESLNALVARFLDFARPLHLELQPTRSQTSPTAPSNRCKLSFQRQTFDIERRYAPGLPDVRCDQQLCERVFVNLIQNAFQAMNDSGAEREKLLRISLKQDTFRGRPGVGVTIEDSGPGVPTGITRADLQSVLHVEEGRGRAGPFDRRQNRGRSSRLDRLESQYHGWCALSPISPGSRVRENDRFDWPGAARACL